MTETNQKYGHNSWLWVFSDQQSIHLIYISAGHKTKGVYLILAKRIRQGFEAIPIDRFCLLIKITGVNRNLIMVVRSCIKEIQPLDYSSILPYITPSCSQPIFTWCFVFLLASKQISCLTDHWYKNTVQAHFPDNMIGSGSGEVDLNCHNVHKAPPCYNVRNTSNARSFLQGRHEIDHVLQAGTAFKASTPVVLPPCGSEQQHMKYRFASDGRKWRVLERNGSNIPFGVEK